MFVLGDTDNNGFMIVSEWGLLWMDLLVGKVSLSYLRNMLNKYGNFCRLRLRNTTQRGRAKCTSNFCVERLRSLVSSDGCIFSSALSTGMLVDKQQVRFIYDRGWGLFINEQKLTEGCDGFQKLKKKIFGCRRVNGHRQISQEPSFYMPALEKALESCHPTT